MNYSISSGPCKPADTTSRSTTCWREWWQTEAFIQGTDWVSLLAAAEAALSRLRVVLMTACRTCGNTRCRNPSFCRACRDADAGKARGELPRYIDASLWRKPDNIPDNWNEMSIEALMAYFDRARRHDGPPQTTVEALILGLRERGTKALEEPAVKRRLGELSDEQLIEVGDRLQKLKPEIARAWSANEIKLLLRARGK